MTKSKVSTSGQTPLSAAETPKDVIDLDSPETKPTNAPTPVAPVEPRVKPQPAPAEYVAPTENALGVRLGEQAMALRLQAEAKGKSDPLQFLGDSLMRLQGILARNGETLGTVERDLGFQGGFALPDDWLALGEGSSSVQQDLNAGTQNNEVVDYSLYIDDSMLGQDEVNAMPSEPAMVTPTPGLDHSSATDPSPESDMITPSWRDVPPARSPVQSNDAGIFGDEGWLGDSSSAWRWEMAMQKMPGGSFLSSVDGASMM